MMRLQTNENRCPLIQALFNFPEEETLRVFSPSQAGGENGHVGEADGAVEEQPCRRRPYQTASETPLWPSLTAVRSAMGKRYPWKKELEKVMRYRSVFICAAMLSVITLGAVAI